MERILLMVGIATVITICSAEEKKVEVKAEPSKTTRGALGQGFELNKIDLLTKQLQASGSKIFEDLTDDCFEDQKLGSIVKDEKTFESTESLYNSIATDSKIEANLQSVFALGPSVEAVTNNIASSKTEIEGFSLNFKAYSFQHDVKKDCINKEPLSKDLISDFEALDSEIKKPHLKQSWRRYSVFLEKYGSHIVKGTLAGSSIYKYVFSKASEKYTKNEFKVKACLSLFGPTNIGTVKVSACTGISKQDIEESKNKDMTKKLVVKGGKSDTRVDLSGELSEKNINEFMKQATTDPSPIEYHFTSIWSILKSR